MNLSSVENFFKKPDLGLLILRVALGLIMMLHGIPKYLGGASRMENTGEAMSVYGIDFLPLLWGFLAATIEVAGGVLLVLGMYFRSVAFLLFFVMLTAFLNKWPGDFSLSNFGGFAHPFTMMWIFFALMFVGPGNYSVHKG